MARLHCELEGKGFAYRADDGSYYFRIAKFPGYGKLSKKDFAGMEDGARVDVDEYEKDSARDFALWKAPKPGEAFWETQIGRGPTGLAHRMLGDVHGGVGRELRLARRWRRPDLSPPRERDRAIGAVPERPFAHFWFHARFLLVEGEKMSKSPGISLPSATWYSKATGLPRFDFCSARFPTAINSTSPLTDCSRRQLRSIVCATFRLRLSTSEFPAGDRKHVQTRERDGRPHAGRHGR